MSTETFIEKANKIHKNFYDYSKTNYTAYKVHLTVICPNHGPFRVSPDVHLSGKKCSSCGNTIGAHKRWDASLEKRKEKFLRESKEIHNNKYDYSLVNFLGGEIGVEIICPEHGIFTQVPTTHLKGSGCRKCSLKIRDNTKRPKNLANFINKAKIIHNNKYSYNNVIYIDSRQRVMITCPVHGDFDQKPERHLRGYGCPKCGLDKCTEKRLTTKQFIDKANKIFNFRFIYNNSEYLSKRKIISIECPEHGEFTLIAGHHLQGVGCPNCSPKISSKEKVWLDSINLPDDPLHRQVFFKIKGRGYFVDGFDPETKTIFEYFGSYFHGNPEYYESNFINPTKNESYGSLYQKTIERTKTFESEGFKVITIWEPLNKEKIKYIPEIKYFIPNESFNN